MHEHTRKIHRYVSRMNIDHGWCLRLGMKYQNSSNQQKHRKTCYQNSGGEYGQPSHHPTRLHGWHHPSLSPPLSCSIEGLFQLSPLQNPSYPLEVLIQHVNAELKMYSISLSLLFVTSSLFHDYSCTLVLIIIRTISYAITIIIMIALLLVWLCSNISYVLYVCIQICSHTINIQHRRVKTPTWSGNLMSCP